MGGTLLSLGHGYSAQAVADVLRPLGWRIIGTTRSAEKMSQFESNGIEARLWPDDDLGEDIKTATHILCSAAPTADGDPFLPSLSAAIDSAGAQWIGYLSTIGVYGDHGGAWVDEDTEFTPTTTRGRHRFVAEQQWQALNPAAHIFRLGGIYGPGRGPFAKIKSGKSKRIIKQGQVFSRIHSEDIAQVVAASIHAPNPGRVYNVVDGDPAPPQDVLSYAAALLGVPAPEEVRFEDAEMSPMARAFYADNKRVRNTRIIEELGVTLKYPDYRSGLKAMLKDEGAA